ncbi:helix-turn-helix transcriptional regulator [Nodosilinea sp. PGN35]|uniref:helix-turn-helix transcriptional regulator n=1 Tax=Nodosilinea sp. PGN35 TaxID=3020489 RepID=UPI0023B2899C|nr:helix-turn-helix transcriptional regulator [Nodosilinea sp. TSF1-S3]MDF0367097.1 helix-turn-helix transcriptional regulator [Nodosilinea sp. TSF1-S3]
MEATTLNQNIRVLVNESFKQRIFSNTDYGGLSNHQSGKNLVEELIGGILVFNDQQKLIYASESAYRVLSQLKQSEDPQNSIPHEIRHICKSLVQSRHLFPNQNWLIEFDIFTNAATTLHICSRWLNLDVIDHPYLLLTIEDRQQAILNLIIEEAERYGLTPREKEVWLLQQNNCTYKQIAAELGITPNTVKKHMRSIYAKKKAQQKEA